MLKLSQNLIEAKDIANRLAMRTGGLVCTEHLLYGMLVCDGAASRILRDCGLSADAVLSVFCEKPLLPQVRMSSRATRAIDNARDVAEELASEEAGTEHLLYAIMDEGSSEAVKIIAAAGLDPELIQRAAYKAIVSKGGATRGLGALVGESGSSVFGISPSVGSIVFEKKHNAEHSASPELGELAKFGLDLTQKAATGKLDPVIGRGREVERVIQILCRRTKNNPLLIGEPGVGKSAVMDGLAQAIADGKVPEALRGKRIFSLDLTSLVAGTRYRGDFEQRFKGALDNIRSRGDVIMFIDEIHTILKAGSSEGGLDVANILKPMLARGELQTAGATTLEEYRKYIEADSALERRFQPILIEQPTVSDTIEILQGLKPKYEAHHKVEITDEAISSAAIMSDRYITDRFLPDKAVDLIDEAASRKKILHFTVPQTVRELETEIKAAELALSEAKRKEQFDKCAKLKEQRDNLVERKEEAQTEWSTATAAVKLSIGEEEIAEIVSDWTGIPLKKLTEGEGVRLKKLDEHLMSRVIGQPEAVSAVARAVKRARAGLKDPNRPIGSFIFLGPTGVGKTELAKALAEALFGDEKLMLRIDMSEYMDKQNVSRLIGSAPGLVGFEEGGQLTEKVRRKPYSVVLFDEVEKAHPDVFNILLQVLEDGRLTDSHGRTVSFKNTVIIMTSNLGAGETEKSKAPLGFNPGGDDSTVINGSAKEIHLSALKRAMKPELINRIDETVIFRSLGKDDIGHIADNMLSALQSRLAEKDVDFEISSEAKAYIAAKGSDAEYGARPLRRTIQRLVEDKLSEMLLSGAVCEGGKVKITLDGNALSFTVAG